MGIREQLKCFTKKMVKKITLKSYSELLQRYRGKNNDYNFVSMEKGKYNLPATFFEKVYLKVYKNFTPTLSGSLVWKVPPYKKQNIYIDLDIEIRDKQNEPSVETFAKFADQVMKIFCELFPPKKEEGILPVVITKRPGPYRKKKDSWHTGAHIYIMGLYTLHQQQALRKAVLELNVIEKVFGMCVNDPSDIYDRGVADRGKGLVMIGGRKPDIDVGAHYICYTNHWEWSKDCTYKTENGQIKEIWSDGVCKLHKGSLQDGIRKFGWEFESTESKKNYDTLFMQFYSFIWEKCEQVVEPTKVKITTQKTTTEFNLQEFLNATEHTSTYSFPKFILSQLTKSFTKGCFTEHSTTAIG